MTHIPQWLAWAQKIQAIAQNGIAYSPNPYDIDRFEQLQALAAEIIAEHASLDEATAVSLFQREMSYMTPKVDVRGAVFRDDALLLVREVADANRWTLPGGWADVGDSPATAVTREVWEESGFEVQAVKLALCLDRNKHPHPPMLYHTYKLFFICEITGGQAKTSYETAAVAFFRQDEMPVHELSLARVVPAQIDRLFAHHYNPSLLTEFD